MIVRGSRRVTLAAGPPVSGSDGASTRLRIAVHDYSGHPFQVQLSRALAERGHEVLHLYSTRFQTPRGPLAGGPMIRPRSQSRGST